MFVENNMSQCRAWQWSFKSDQGLVLQACDPSLWEAEAGGLQGQGWPGQLGDIQSQNYKSRKKED